MLCFCVCLRIVVSNTYCVVFLCLFTYSGVQHILCCVFVLGFLVMCTSMLSGLFILDCPFGFHSFPVVD